MAALTKKLSPIDDEAFPSKYHPLFQSPEADIVLRSSDGIYFRLYSYTLRTTSGWFHDMFSLPQCAPSTSNSPYLHQNESWSGSQSTLASETTIAETEEIPTNETSEVLAIFFLLLAGRPAPKGPLYNWGNFDLIERVLTLAENWDAPGPISHIRAGIISTELLERDPLRVYAIACHFEWEMERQLAAKHTLQLDLFRRGGYSEEESVDGQASYTGNQITLASLSSRDLLYLLRLRQHRRDVFRRLLESPARFSAGNSDEFFCSRCGVTKLDNQSWRALKDALMLEMDRRPLGHRILGKEVDGISGKTADSKGSGGVLCWPEAQPCWEATCSREGCGSLNYDRIATLKQLRICIESLPFDLETEQKVYE
uniref:BTB domain-containing protein n=1 Tax=Moniliophthora roreri TaxID=221103 RepID=A0A0W0GEC4_MONRR